MKKQLVEAGDIAAHLSQDGKTFYANNSMILTPGAKDALSNKGIAIVCGEKPEHDEACCCEAPAVAGGEELLIAVGAMIKNEFGINDPETLKALTCQAVKTIRDNI
ncbi:hypothetical protein [Pseudodesulfovibrio sp. zrk46]|uniref:hypothetical protein n=1 Tax=Pseudodesulfovibrio sp. zrk46 TaxID=2725288 RepID=UPI0014492A97|nr:hypothetical protein [Pseudodesulfovibrio sp. zrk46]QJB57065.1 hypothetical protein HFN16_11930 [Pseudodesulfovibrio sp. zrk46]